MTTILMGVSKSNNDHGGTEEWDVWRAYTQSSMLTLANRTGSQRPVALAYSKDGPNLGGATPNYTSVFNEVLADLNSFYYTTTIGQTHTARWGIKLYWSNGNENHDKGALAEPHTPTGIANYIISQHALYDAVHYIDPTTGQRRFPDAFAGSDPTHDAELRGVVADWLHPSAQYHDFVMWSMYPPGRKSTTDDPTYNWPSFVDADYDNNPQGFLIRCFRRTKLAEAAGGHPLMIACGEVGTGNDPDDMTTRPYYAVHGLAWAMEKLAIQYDLEMPFACWWDQQVDASAPQNILSDENPLTSPSTREAWQNYASYNHLNGGTHPASWAGNPKGTWKTSGTHPTGLTSTNRFGTASLTLSGSGTAHVGSASRAGTASLSLSGTVSVGVGIAGRTGTASMSLSATGTLIATSAARTGTASMALSGSLVVRNATASMTVLAAGFAKGPWGGLGPGAGTLLKRIVARNPVALWRFNDASVATDSGPGGHHGIFIQTFETLGTVSTAGGLLRGDPDPSYVLGDGVSIYVPWGTWMDREAFSFGGFFEVTAMVPETLYGVVSRASVDKFCWGVFLEDDTIRLSSSYQDAESVALAPGIYAYVVTGDATSIILYLNGVAVSTIPSVIDNTGGEFSFGAPLGGFTQTGFPGRIDEFVYYDYKLAAADIYLDYLEWSNGQTFSITMLTETDSVRPLMPGFGYTQTYRSVVTDQGAWAYWAHAPGALGVDSGSLGHDATVPPVSVWDPLLGPTQPVGVAPILLQNSSTGTALESQDDFASSECTFSAWIAVAPYGSTGLSNYAGAITTPIPLVGMAAAVGSSTFDKCLYLDTAGKLCWLTGTGGSLEVITDSDVFPQDGLARHVAVSVGPAGTKIRVSGVTKATGANTSSYAGDQKIFYFDGGTGGGRDFTYDGSQMRHAWAQATVFDSQLSDVQTDLHHRLGRSIRNIEYFWGVDSVADAESFGAHSLLRTGSTLKYTGSPRILVSDPALGSQAVIATAGIDLASGLEAPQQLRHVYWQPNSLAGHQDIFSLMEYTQQFATAPASVLTVTLPWRLVSIDGDLTWVGQSTTNHSIEQDRFTHSVPLVDGIVNSVGMEMNGSALDLWVNGFKESFTRTQSAGWSVVSAGNQQASYTFGGILTPSPIPATSVNHPTGYVAEVIHASVGFSMTSYDRPEMFFEDLAIAASEQGLTIEPVVETETVFELGVGLDAVSQSLAIDMVLEANEVFAFHQRPDGIQTLVETSTVFNFPFVVLVTVEAAGEIILVDEDITSDDADLGLRILDPEVLRAPTSITVTVSGGRPQEEVTFDIDGTVVYTVSLDSDGMLGPTSIPVSAALGTLGLHVLTVTQVTSGGTITDSETFTVLQAPAEFPTDAGPDAPPVEVPGALTFENGNPVRHWVFQDLLGELDGGIGSYVFPHNPASAGSPHLEHALTSRHSTARDGKLHIFQAGNTPKEWQFSGYCPSEDQQQQMTAYRNLNRRLYVIDHRNRAWKAVITDAQFIPRLRQSYNGIPTDWGSDYTITAVVVDQEPQIPEEV